MRYQKEITHTDFRKSGEKFIVEVSEKEHGCGEFPIFQIYMKQEIGYTVAFVSTRILDGKIQFECSVTFDGVIVFA